ncbi:dynein beta chain, flagellar outer arm [Plakobranchus ocellatus]|uniref:Dynein beta chain, flagellar outer arm n=1 Tax=Plakobranchus ocellatus TaxID=259542 RepID=A0AAV4C1B9_9GAST|nr:dynein beta chain, flagellar outer arm [Plakobranchus ocellatus]
MATDERLKWLEQRIGSSMRPRNEDLKNMMANDENRLAFYEFVNNEDVKRLLVYMRPGRQIVAALQPPMELQSKSIYFLKCNPGTKLTKDNMDAEVYYTDSSNVPLEHLELTIREVFLPLLSTNNMTLASASGSGDKVMDILHRLMAAVEVTQGHVEGRIVLNLPSIEVLAEAAASPSRRAAVLHVLETTVIGWIKQIRAVLRHDPQEALTAQFGKEPGPLDEIAMWETHLERLRSIDDQLASDVAKDILQNLESANSQYAQSFSGVRKDISKAEAETSRILKFLSTMEPWYKKLHASTDSQAIIKLFKPLMHVLNLVWSYST